MLVRSRHATGGERACCMTRPNNGSEGDNSECCTNAVYFAYNYLDNKDNRPQKTCDWVYFEWIERAFFALSIKRYFRRNLLKRNYFFLVQKMQKSITWWPILTHNTLACVACLCLHTAWPRGEESHFNASFNVTLDAINDLSACRPVLFGAAATRISWTIFFFIFIRYIRFNSWKLTCNFSCITISMHL